MRRSATAFTGGDALARNAVMLRYLRIACRRPTAAARDAVRNRARLLEAAAARVPRARGSARASTRSRADAGVNVATLYRHFPTKDDLLAAVLDALLEPLAAARDRALEADDGDGPLAHVPPRGGPPAARATAAWSRRSAATRSRRGARAAARAGDRRSSRRSSSARTRDGELRADFDAVDVLHRAADARRRARRARGRRARRGRPLRRRRAGRPPAPLSGRDRRSAGRARHRADTRARVVRRRPPAPNAAPTPAQKSG